LTRKPVKGLLPPRTQPRHFSKNDCNVNRPKPGNLTKVGRQGTTDY
jgi:hypothetical protein